MKLMGKVLSLFSILLLVSCASSGVRFVQDQSLTPENSSIVHMYRTDTSYHSLNPEKPFFYVDDRLIGKLGTGGYVTIRVKPGKHEFSVRESVAFMPGFESGKVLADFEAGEEYYIRYSKNFSGATVVGGTAFLSGDSVFSESTKEKFLRRE